MQTFYVIIKKDYLSLYEKNGNVYEKVYLGGNPEYFYSVNNAKDYVNHLFEMIIEEYNLDTIGEIDFIVFDNEDVIISNAMLEAFGQSVKERISIEHFMMDVSDSLGRDKKLHISEYGINFDGKNYVVKNRQIVKEEFSLLAYSLNDEMLIKFVG